jgi:hypothetical protein
LQVTNLAFAGTSGGAPHWSPFNASSFMFRILGWRFSSFIPLSSTLRASSRHA